MEYKVGFLDYYEIVEVFPIKPIILSNPRLGLNFILVNTNLNFSIQTHILTAAPSFSNTYQLSLEIPIHIYNSKICDLLKEYDNFSKVKFTKDAIYWILEDTKIEIDKSKLDMLINNEIIYRGNLESLYKSLFNKI